MRKKLLSEKVCLGSWIQTANEVCAEIIASKGFDWIAVDMEHTETDIHDFTKIMRAVSKYDVYPMARVQSNETMAIRRCLDCGAKGVIIPLVNNAEDARRAVAAAKYPPMGIRGFAFVRANEWGDSFDDYAKNANDETLVIAMIESKQAVENIDEILSVEGIDGIFIGPYDLSGSYGIPGQTDHKIIKEAKEKVRLACLEHKKACGQHIVLPTKENVSEAVNTGYTFIALGMDTVFVSDGAQKCIEMAGKV